MSKHTLVFQSIESFVDYENVEPGIGPIKEFFKYHNGFPLTEAFDKPKGYWYKFDEHQISLEDHLLQIYSEPEEFTLLNVNPVPEPEYSLEYLQGSDIKVEILFDLSNPVHIEKRVVMSLTSVLGEIGGFYGILVGLAFFFSFKLPEKLFMIDQVRTLFRAADPDEK